MVLGSTHHNGIVGIAVLVSSFRQFRFLLLSWLWPTPTPVRLHSLWKWNEHFSFRSLIAFCSVLVSSCLRLPHLILVHVLILGLVYTIITNIPLSQDLQQRQPRMTNYIVLAQIEYVQEPAGVWTRNGVAGTRMSTLSCGFLAVASSRRAREVDKDAEK